jgi:nucleotide-binding universal stress UspA family protein
MPTIRRILGPVDFSETSEHAADYATALARQLGASLHFVHAWQMPIYAFPDGAVILGPDVVAKITTDLQRSLDAVVERHRDRELDVKAHLVEGIADREISRLAHELGADLVVMGTHGRTGLPHLLLGSVAERVVRTSHVPVLAVPRKKSEKK